jgi:hypothetical protein
VRGNDGGRVRIRGPLGLSRVAETRVLEARPPRGGGGAELHGRAHVGRTLGRVKWRIDPHATGSQVTLSAWVERTNLIDRVLLALGGRWWLQRIFANAVQRLEEVA